MEELTPSLWEVIKRLTKDRPDVPLWVRALLEHPIQFVINNAVINVEQKAVDESYLAFLQQQIDLSPRGLEWNTVLRKRLIALAPHVGEEVVTVTISQGKEWFVVRLIHQPEAHMLQCETA